MRTPLSRCLSCALLAVLAACGRDAPADAVRGGDLGAADACRALEGETIRWIVSSSPGGGYDVYSRLVQPFLERVTGARVVVENRPGAEGRIAYGALLRAQPDGRTLGIVNGPGLLIRSLIGDDTPHPVRDFTVLGRITRGTPVLFTRGDSPVRTIRQLVDAGLSGPLLFGTASVGSGSWVWSAIVQDLLGVDMTMVSGFAGTRETSMALIRGDVDFAAYTFDSVRDRTESGAIRPVMFLSEHSPADRRGMEDVPSLAGPRGVAAVRALELGRDPVAASAMADAWVEIYELGRLVVAPPGMDPALRDCLAAALRTVIHDPGFVSVAAEAHRSVVFGDPDTVISGLEGRSDAIEAVAEQLARVGQASGIGSVGR